MSETEGRTPRRFVREDLGEPNTKCPKSLCMLAHPVNVGTTGGSSLHVRRSIRTRRERNRWLRTCTIDVWGGYKETADCRPCVPNVGVRPAGASSRAFGSSFRSGHTPETTSSLWSGRILDGCRDTSSLRSERYRSNMAMRRSATRMKTQPMTAACVVLSPTPTAPPPV